MISYFHLAAVCCIPLPNPPARRREQDLFRQVAANQKQFAVAPLTRLSRREKFEK